MASNVYDSTLFSGDPYYDDFDDSKKFLRMLFRPGYAVQARELTQLQTIIQSQIERFGSHVFEDGSIVLGSQVAEDTVNFARLDSVAGTNTLSEFESLNIVKSDGSTAKAIVLHTLTATSGDNYDMIFFDYIEGGTGFTTGDLITTTGASVTTPFTATITGATSGFTGQSMGTATLVTVSEGVRFVDGFFVLHDEDRTVPYEVTGSATRYFDTPTNIVGFNITKSIVDEDDDSTLNDNAYGSYNYAAPGSHRYKIDLVLNSYAWDPTTLGTSANYSQEDFIEILKLNEGVVVYRSMYPEYAVLEDTFARRTYDESGNYTVRAFDISLVNGSTASTFNAKLEAGKAYVFGYEFETLAPTEVAMDRARGSAAENTLTTIDFDRTIGSYVNVILGGGTASIQGADTYDLDTHTLLQLGTGQSADFIEGITDGQVIGTARSRQLYSNADGTYRLYIYDIQMTGGNVFENVRSFWAATGASSAAFYVDVSSQVGNAHTGNTQISLPNSSNLLFEVPSGEKVKTINSLDYSISQYYPDITFAGGTAVISTGYSDPEIDFSGGAGYYNIGLNNNSIVFTRGGTTVSGDTGKTGTRQLEIQLDNTGITLASLVVSLDVSDTNASVIRTKTDTSETITLTGTTAQFSADSNGTYFLNLNGLVDVYSISGITSGLIAGGTTNAINYFSLDTGQRDNLYDWSRIKLKDPANSSVLTGPYTIDISRYAHAGKGPFTVDSYTGGIDYDDIPYYTSPVNGYIYDLRDCLDFRPIKNVDQGICNAWTPQVGTDFEGGYVHYLPRSAKLVLNRDRTFGVLYGPYDAAAPIPADSDDAMTLYILKIPPYTHNTTDIGVRFVENKRYTMRDIGRLEKRIEDVEYYTTLSLLEQEAKNLSILDSVSLERPKNGILVDGFKHHGVADVTNSWHRAAINADDGELRPPFGAYALGATFAAAGASAFADQKKGMLFLPYTSNAAKIAVVQPFVTTTESINVFGIQNWIGSLSISPVGDSWFDDMVRPIVRSNTSHENDAWVGSGYSFGYNHNWNFWENNWYGVQVIDDKNIKQVSANISSEADADIYGKIPVNRATNTNIDAIKKTISNRTVNLSVVPYIKAQDITINASGLKPLTTHYVFFDGEDATSNCTGTLTTDANGAISGVVFSVPASTYKAGEKLLRITDSSSNTLSSTVSAADAIFYATGLYATKEDGIYGVRPSVAKRASVRSEIVSTNIFTRDIQRRNTSNYKAVDPMAQEFSVSAREFPNGMYVKTLRLCFSAKDEVHPVCVSIRPVANGYPHPSKVVPNSEKILPTGSVNTGTNPESNYTEFEFDAPVYLAPGKYAFTVSSAGKGYVLRAAEVGQKTSFGGNTTNDRATPSPNVGGLYQAQNSGTWKKNNSKFVYFVMHRCVFDTTARIQMTNNETRYSGTVDMGAYRISAPEFKPSATDVVWHYNTTPNQVIANTVIPLSAETSIGLTDSGAFTVYADLSSSSDAVSPIVDETMFKFIAIENQIGVYDSSATITESNPTPDGATGTIPTARYISRKVTLRDGFESADVNVYLLAHLPQNTSIEVYAKYQASDDATRFEDLPWTKLSLKSGYAASNATTDDDFQELAYQTGDVGTLFNTFAVKIVMYSSDATVGSAKYPRIKNMRAIALPAP